MIYGREAIVHWQNSQGASQSPRLLLLELDGLRDFMDHYGEPRNLATWHDEDPRCDDLNISRVRGKYYGARYLILRPFLQQCMQWHNNDAKPPGFQEPVSRKDTLPLINLRKMEESSANVDHEFQGEERSLFIGCAKGAIDAALNSTVAFDGLLPNRFLITNIHGTMLA